MVSKFFQSVLICVPMDFLCVERGRERGKEKLSKILSSKFIIWNLNKPPKRQDIVFLGFLYAWEEIVLRWLYTVLPQLAGYPFPQNSLLMWFRLH